MSTITASIVTSENFNTLLDFLKENNLPYQDLQLDGNLFLIYHSDKRIMGCGGIEEYGHNALLRSIAVDLQERGKKIGQRIVADLIAEAKNKKIESLFLLTETARPFFLKLGFKDVPRDEAPDALKQSSEFSHVCPMSAACMKYYIAQ